MDVDGSYIKTNFWQSSQPGSETVIEVERASDGTATTLKNVIACVYDRDVMGIYKLEEEVLTTPVNAAGRYYNTYWHEKQMWFNDLSENFVGFAID